MDNKRDTCKYKQRKCDDMKEFFSEGEAAPALHAFLVAGAGIAHVRCPVRLRRLLRQWMSLLLRLLWQRGAFGM